MNNGDEYTPPNSNSMPLSRKEVNLGIIANSASDHSIISVVTDRISGILQIFMLKGLSINQRLKIPEVFLLALGVLLFPTLNSDSSFANQAIPVFLLHSLYMQLT